MRVYTRVREQYTTFKKITPGQRFRTSGGNGPFVKWSGRYYEDSRVGTLVKMADTTTRVKREWPVGIRPE
jgi:hypothetical protein